MSRQQKKIATIRAVAVAVRCWAKALQRKLGLWCSNLSGMCGICAYELFTRLKKKRFKVIVAIGWHHAFVVWRDYVIDVTATQFKPHLPAVCCVRDGLDKEYFWEARYKAIETHADAKRRFRSWERAQSPFHYMEVKK